MKKLSELKLNESFEFLSKQEMKVVVGGYGGGACGNGSNELIMINIFL